MTGQEADLVLRPDRLVAEVVEATGLDDFGEDTWREGLERLTSALRDEARLHELGVFVAADDIRMHLTNRLQVTDWHRRHPEMAEVDVTPPIVVVGQGRTGTTILHDLLAQDPAHRVPLTWEVDAPCPPPETATYDTDPRIAEAQARADGSEALIPGFQAIHPMGALLSQECVRITAGDFRSMIFPTVFAVPSYARWLLDEADMASAYRWHRRLLQLLQWRHPGERWVLKSPGHIWCLDALLAEYPGALLVQTHRDPLRIIASLGSLLGTLRQLGSDEHAIAPAAAEFADYVLDGLDRSVTARENGTVAADRVVDVTFAAFMEDPFGAIGGIYDRFGLEFTSEAEMRMRAFLDAHPNGAYGAHRYRFADTGLDEGQLRERARRYQDYFAVPSEQLP